MEDIPDNEEDIRTAAYQDEERVDIHPVQPHPAVEEDREHHQHLHAVDSQDTARSQVVRHQRLDQVGVDVLWQARRSLVRL